MAFNAAGIPLLGGMFADTTASTPGAAGITNYYLNLLSGLAQGQGITYASQAQYAPLFGALQSADLDRLLMGGPDTTQSVQVPYATGQWYNSYTGEVAQKKGQGQGWMRATAPGTVSRTTAVPASRGLLDIFSNAVVPALNTATSSSRAAGVADVANLGPGAAAAVRAVNPQESALADELASTAQEQLSLGTRLAPEDIFRVTQGVRGDWANRGLGASDPAMLDEAVNLATAGQNVLAQRESAAAAAAGVEGNLTNPALALAAGNPAAIGQSQNFLTGAEALNQGSAAQTLVSGAQMQDVWNTAFNSRAAANISTANNQAAVGGASASY